jgi:hypothetical protein
MNKKIQNNFQIPYLRDKVLIFRQNTTILYSVIIFKLKSYTFKYVLKMFIIKISFILLYFIINNILIMFNVDFNKVILIKYGIYITFILFILLLVFIKRNVILKYIHNKNRLPVYKILIDRYLLSVSISITIYTLLILAFYLNKYLYMEIFLINMLLENMVFMDPGQPGPSNFKPIIRGPNPPNGPPPGGNELLKY